MQDEVFGVFLHLFLFLREKNVSDEIEPSKDSAFVGLCELSFYC